MSPSSQPTRAPHIHPAAVMIAQLQSAYSSNDARVMLSKLQQQQQHLQQQQQQSESVRVSNTAGLVGLSNLCSQTAAGKLSPLFCFRVLKMHSTLDLFRMRKTAILL